MLLMDIPPVKVLWKKVIQNARIVKSNTRIMHVSSNCVKPFNETETIY